MAKSVEELQQLTPEQLAKLWEDANNKQLEPHLRGMAWFEYGASHLLKSNQVTLTMTDSAAKTTVDQKHSTEHAAMSNQSASAASSATAASKNVNHSESIDTQKAANIKFANECIVHAANKYHVFEALIHLGMSFLNEEIIFEDENEWIKESQHAFVYFNTASQADSLERGGYAWAALGYCHRYGIGTDMNPEQAYTCYIKSAEYGCAEALCSLGWVVETGYANQAKNPGLAANYYYQAAIKNNSIALKNLIHLASKNISNAYYFLAQYYVAEINNEEGIVKKSEFNIAYEMMTKAAELGSRRAQFVMYRTLKSGAYGTHKVAVDPIKALEYLRSSANLNLVEAQFELGTAYHKGKEIAASPKDAEEWFGKAAIQGHMGAQYMFAQYLEALGLKSTPRNDELLQKAFHYMEQAANKNLIAAQFKLVSMHENGIGTPTSHPKALFWLQKLADNGHAKSQYMLGMFLKNQARKTGDKNSAFHTKAYHYFNLAAIHQYTDVKVATENDYFNSLVELGKCYYLGVGVNKDYSKAVTYFTAVLKNCDHVEAKFYSGRSLIEGKGVAKNLELGLKLLIEVEQKLRAKYSSSYTYRVTTLFLGMCFEKGIGTPIDLKSALTWFKISADKGNKVASECYSSLTDKIAGKNKQELDVQTIDKTQAEQSTVMLSQTAAAMSDHAIVNPSADAAQNGNGAGCAAAASASGSVELKKHK